MDLDVNFAFKPIIELPEKTTVDKPTDLNMKIESNVYKENLIDHDFQFVSDKKTKIISPDGDTIRMNTPAKIPHDGNFHKYQFIGEEIGVHQLKFLFKNSKKVEISEQKNILVEYEDFNLTAETGNIGSINVPKKNHCYFIKRETRWKGSI